MLTNLFTKMRLDIQSATRPLIKFAILRHKGYVNFGFFFGAGLPDSEKLLIGEGKRLRHVKVWGVEEAKNPALAKLIASTWKEAPESVAKVHAGLKKSKA